MRPLTNYYGGKYLLSKEIIKLIPFHKTYVEPFAGGAALFFVKKLAYKNILNDKEKYLMNMYIQYKKYPKNFCKILRYLPHSEILHKISRKYKIKNKLISACRYWYSINCSFSCIVGSGWTGLARTDKNRTNYFNKLKRLSEKILKIKHASLFCRDALWIIDFFDSKDTFYYIDPPYPGADQGHYSGYTLEDYKILIEKLKTIQGKFILSNYIQNNELPKEWYIKEIEVNMTASNSKDSNNKREKRKELLIMNYIPDYEKTLFNNNLYNKGNI